MHDTRRRWQVFSVAPHRMFFASGVVWLLAWSGWWAMLRVTLGHSGRPLALDPLNWRLFLVIQAAAALRVLAEFLPAAGGALSLLAALAWFFAFAAWGLRQLPIYLRPRVDGAPG